MKSPKEFLELLDKCKRQVEYDPGTLRVNPHLHKLQHKVFLRLCHGNIPDFKVDPETGKCVAHDDLLQDQAVTEKYFSDHPEVLRDLVEEVEREYPDE